MSGQLHTSSLSNFFGLSKSATLQLKAVAQNWYSDGANSELSGQGTSASWLARSWHRNRTHIDCRKIQGLNIAAALAHCQLNTSHGVRQIKSTRNRPSTCEAHIVCARAQVLLEGSQIYFFRPEKSGSWVDCGPHTRSFNRTQDSLSYRSLRKESFTRN